MSAYRQPSFCDLLDPFQEEFNNFMLGEYIGSGESRAVYEDPMQPKRWVIKIERSVKNREFHNIREWNLWNETEDYPEARSWLAPCHRISMGGRILVMARTKPLKGVVDLKGVKIPDFLGDCHYRNLGIYKGRIVCHDYAYARVTEKAVRSFRLVKNERESDT